MEKKPIIGLEIHLQLATKSKMFCNCPNTSSEEKPNVNICPICTGQPGSLPSLNQKAVEMILKLGLALNGEIEKKFYFERKNYFYPDLPKGYQISQKKTPIIKNAFLEIGDKKIKIQEMHLEEDTAKIYHQADNALIDFNRAGSPLLEIVTTPEITSAREAKQFCEELQAIVRTIGISTANMERGEMRCEVNVSINKGKRVEIKNLNSLRTVERSIEYEIKRQNRLLEEDREIIQETRGWDEKNKKTFVQRTKEEAEDYRYFSEPDLPVFEISAEEIKRVEESLPELPSEQRMRLIKNYGFDYASARIFVTDKEIMVFVEKTMDLLVKKLQEDLGIDKEENKKKIAKKFTNWLARLLGFETMFGGRFLDKISSEDFASFMAMLLEKKIFSNQIAQNILQKMYQTGQPPEIILGEESMKELDDSEEIKKAIELVLENYPEAAADYKKGKKNAIKYLLGQVMAATKGKAGPQEIEKMLENMLND